MKTCRYLDYDYVWQTYAFYWGSDLFSVNNPYLLLLFSKKLRGYFLSMITCGRVQQTIGQTTVKLSLKMTLIMAISCRKCPLLSVRSKYSRNSSTRS